MMRSQLWSVVLSIFLWTEVSPAAAQSKLADLIDASLSAGSAVVPSVGVTTKPSLQTLQQHIELPNWLDRNATFLSALAQFDTIPDASGRLPSGAPSLKKVLSDSAGVVEFSKPIGTDSSNVAAAYKILFADEDHKSPSKNYKEYLQRKEEYEAQATLLKTTTDPARKAVLIASLQKLNTNWSLFGHKSEIEAALAIVSSNQDASSSGSYNSWKASIPDGSSIDPLFLAYAVGRTDWIRISVSSDALKKAVLNLHMDGTAIVIPAISRLTFEYISLNLRRPALEHPFLSDDTWRFKNGLVLSEGDASSSASELLPRYVGGLVLIRNIELAFAEQLSTEALSALSQSGEAELGGWRFNTAGSYFQQKLLSLTRPAITSYVVYRLQKTPNPSSNRSWP